MSTEPMEEVTRYRQDLMARYGEQPIWLRERIQAYTKEGQHVPLGDGEWTPHQVLAHVVAAETEAMLPRLRRIASEVDPFLETWDETGWMAEQYDDTVETGALLAGFDRLRQQGQTLLAGLSGEDWSRTGRHGSQGTRTLQWWLEYTVAHVDDHLSQLDSAAEGA